MEIVSFKVAKAISIAGYPQGWGCEKHYCLESEGEYGYQIGDLVSANTVHKNCLEAISAPTYFEVWIWLWKEKDFRIQIEDNYCKVWRSTGECAYRKCYSYNIQDPEIAIIEAIEYLVDNKLLK